MAMTGKKRVRSSTMVNDYVPDPQDTSVPPKGAVVSPAKRAIEDLKRSTGVLERYLHEQELQAVDEERFDRLNEQNAALVQKINDTSQWLGMIKEALGHYDEGELSARRFANEVDAAIKGWEGT